MKKRVYNSEGRVAQAVQTKADILKAAKLLFSKRGFEQVTIGNLAEKAQVSMPTIYSLFKSKKGVLQALIDEALPSEIFATLVDSSMQESSPHKRLALTAKLARQIYDAEKEIIDIVRGASVLSPELKELEQERESRRHTRQGDYIKKLMKDKHLSKDLTLDQARDLAWALTGRDLYRMLVIERGWSSDDYEKHLYQLLIKSLLK
jgi:AcrR family transcriptional regulator